MCDVTDNKTFWRKVKPLSERVNLQTKITLVEKEKTLSEPEISAKIENVILDDNEVAETLNDFW